MPGLVLANAVDVDQVLDVEVGDLLENGIKWLEHAAEILHMPGQLAVLECRNFDDITRQKGRFVGYGVLAAAALPLEEARESPAQPVAPR